MSETNDPGDTWKKVLTLYKLKQEKSIGVEKLKVLLESLADDRNVEVPPGEKTGEEEELARRFGWEPEMDCYGEQAFGTTDFFTVNDVAIHVLDNTSIPPTDDTLSLFLNFAGTGVYEIIRWINRRFNSLEFEKPGATYKKYLSALLKAGCEDYYGLVKDRKEEDLAPVARFAVSKSINFNIISVLLSESPHGKAAVIKSLAVCEGTLGESMLPFLLRISSDTVLLPEVLVCMKRIEEEGAGLAAGYTALFDAQAVNALPGWQPPENMHALLLENMESEVNKTAACWEDEKQARIKNPDQFYYDDRKAPLSVLSGIDRGWQPMYELAGRLGGAADMLGLMHKLMTEPWHETLLKLTEK
ncbi:MAG: hypothetical protein JW969_13295 [Spirochaetales bacterium]|nr:hypothetical protein [Spirochaetales bacterium]